MSASNLRFVCGVSLALSVDPPISPALIKQRDIERGLAEVWTCGTGLRSFDIYNVARGAAPVQRTSSRRRIPIVRAKKVGHASPINMAEEKVCIFKTSANTRCQVEKY